MPLRFALPKGRLATGTKYLLYQAGMGLDDYGKNTRLYRLKSANFPALDFKVLHEKDIPIQVAIGNYDMGICGLDWIQELMTKYPSSNIFKLKDLDYGKYNLCLTTSKIDGITSLEELRAWNGDIRIASEYPNIAESFALRMRLKRFRIFPIWGAAEAFPPENADIVLLACPPEDGLAKCGLNNISTIFTSSAYIIVNQESWKQKDMSSLLDLFTGKNIDRSTEEAENLCSISASGKFTRINNSILTLALPDGHQQEPTAKLLQKAGFAIEEYMAGYLRPDIGMLGLGVKVIRPQDMPLQVANGNFDLAITGEDWLQEHLYRFPSSPVKKILKLGFGEVRIVAVVSMQLAINDAAGLRELLRNGTLPAIRVVSEYVSIADRYAWDKHLSPYRIVPSWGASEAFLPEDADLLIENVQTGQTIARNKLKIIDTLFRSSACLISNTDSLANPVKMEKIDTMVQKLGQLLPVGG